MILTMLGSREIWTQEHRWADIVFGMFYRHDFLHPYLDDVDYYDKPLLSYWMIAGISYLSGQLSTWVLRLPSAIAGILSIWSIYRIGTKLQNKQLGLLAGWMMLTTYYFIFWARTSSADMLNLAGILFAIAWYLDKRDKPGFINYVVFFLILAVTSLCKGLVGAVVPLLVVLPDLIMQNGWKKHLRVSFFLAMVPAIIVYILPFLASAHFGGSTYNESGLYLVYRENVLRYFQPFDHKGTIYTYFLWLPIYLLPWTFFFIPVLITLKSRWASLTHNMKWMSWAVLLLFVFFTLSGSRRNYYILPLVPFALLMTANWILTSRDKIIKNAGGVAFFCFVLFFATFDVLQPLYYAQGGIEGFAKELRATMNQSKPGSDWQFVLLDPEGKVRYYLQLAPTVKNYLLPDADSRYLTQKTLLRDWPVLQQQQSNMIFISRKKYEPILRNILVGYRVIETPESLGERLLHIESTNAPIAFIKA